MAAERPPVSKFWKSDIQQKPIADSFWVGDGRTTIGKSQPKPVPAQEEKIPFFPVKEDIPGLVAAGAHAVTQGLTDVGREPISKIMGGYPGEMIQKGFKAAKNPRRLAQAVAMGPGRAIQEVLQTPVETPEDYGFPVLPQPRSIMGRVGAMGIEAGTGALMGRAGARSLARIAPAMEESAVKISQNLLRPGGRFLKRSPQIAKAALEEGVLRSSAKGTQEAAQARIDALLGQVDELAENAPDDLTISPKSALRRMDARSRWFKTKPDAAAKVQGVKRDIISGENLTEPIYEDVERGQFVMKGGKQVSPEMRDWNTRKMPVESKMKALKKNREGGFWGMSGQRRIVSPKNFIEQPEDVVALHRPGKQGAVITPKESYQIRGDIKGPSVTERALVGEKFKDLSVKKALQIRRKQDQILKAMKAGGGFGAETNSAEILGRQDFSNTMRRSLANAIPEIGEKNRRISKLIDVQNVSQSRSGVSGRNNFFDLVDSGLTSGAIVNPKLWIPFLARKGYQIGKAGIARSLYGASKFGKSAVVKNLPKALAAQSGRRLLTYVSE